jgi:hypothetical protein
MHPRSFQETINDLADNLTPYLKDEKVRPRYRLADTGRDYDGINGIELTVFYDLRLGGRANVTLWQGMLVNNYDIARNYLAGEFFWEGSEEEILHRYGSQTLHPTRRKSLTPALSLVEELGYTGQTAFVLSLAAHILCEDKHESYLKPEGTLGQAVEALTHVIATVGEATVLELGVEKVVYLARCERISDDYVFYLDNSPVLWLEEIVVPVLPLKTTLKAISVPENTTEAPGGRRVLRYL